MEIVFLERKRFSLKRQQLIILLGSQKLQN